MARTSWNPEVGTLPANKPGDHGGIAIVPGHLSQPSAEGSTGNPGTELPWKGADATDIGFDTALPPLTHLGEAGGGHA